MVYYIVSVLFLLFFWCMVAIYVSVQQYNGVLLPDIILLTQCYLHRGTRLNAIEGCCCCLLLFLTFSALVANPKKTTFHGGQSRSWSAEQRKKEKENVWQRTPPPRARALLVRRKKKKKKKKKKKITRRIHMSRRYASRRYAGGGLGPSRIRTRIPTTRQLGQWVSLRKTLRFRVRLQLSQSRCLSLLLAMSGRVFLFLPPRGHEPPPTLRDRLNPNLSLYRHRFPIPRDAKRPDVALYTVGPFFLLPTPSSTHCALKVSEHDSLWQPPAAHSEERSRPQKSSRAQRCLNALAPGNLKGTVVRGHPVVWSLAVRSDERVYNRTRLAIGQLLAPRRFG